MSATARAAAKSRGTVSLKNLTGQREPRLRAMFESAAIGIGACSIKGRVLEANAVLRTMLGYSRDELPVLRLRDLYPAGFPPADRALLEVKRGQRKSLQQEGQYRRKDGSLFWGRLAVSLASTSACEPALLIAVLEDVTEHKRANEMSREAEKMEVIGRLAGGIAHDFNNLLTGVLLYCDLLADGMERGTPLLRHVEEIRLAGEQGAALTQQLLALARKENPRPRPIQINDVISSTENMLRRLIGEQIELTTVLAPRLPTVRADPTQLRQVLLNLVLNARDAMPQGGRVTVRTLARARGQGTRALVSMLVEDTGCGMDEPTRARLFEPFFTTKTEGHGTGLGLATVQRIVSESGGTIEITSEAGRGTVITVSFPAANSSPISHALPKSVPDGRAILLVDDHASARNSIQRMLHHAGFQVLPASSGKQALKVFTERGHDVGLLLADWMMPGMSGRELAERLRHLKPELKVLLISGYHNSREGPPDHSVELIRKPFAGRVLLDRVREVFHCKGD